MTIPADAALLWRHLTSGRDHVRQAIINVEGLAGRPDADVDSLYAIRAELRHLGDVLANLAADVEISS